EVAAAVGGQKRAGVITLLAVAEALAPDAGQLLPGPVRRWEDGEGLGLGHADELRSLRPVADVVPMAVGEEVCGGAVDELEAFCRHRLPVRRRDALAHDAACDRGELVVDVRDVFGVDPLADFLDALCTPVGFDEALEVRCRHELPPGRWGGARILKRATASLHRKVARAG